MSIEIQEPTHERCAAVQQYTFFRHLLPGFWVPGILESVQDIAGNYGVSCSGDHLQMAQVPYICEIAILKNNRIV